MQIPRSLHSLAPKKITAILVAMASLALFLSSGQAALVVNVDLNGQSTNTYSGQGAYSDPGHNTWNGFNLSGDHYFPPTTPISSGVLLDSAGVATSVQLTLSGAFYTFNYTTFSGGTYATGNALLDDVIYAISSENPSPATFTLSGLTPGASYALYLYGAAGIDGSAHTTYTVNGSSLSTVGRSSALTPTIFTQGADYAFYTSVLAGLDGTITGSYQGTSGGAGFLDGLQIVAAVPEPSTYALSFAGLGAMILVMHARSRNKSS